MKKVLITGGPVHCFLDAIKIITNRFRGGLMVQLADDLAEHVQVTYLCAANLGMTLPRNSNVILKTHNGFEDYRRLVSELAPKMDAVILGAAVANLIPAEPFKGKFPSHNYKPGDLIPINFTIAPRVIDDVKKVAPNTHLFGYKLLAGVSHNEFISAAYDIVLESKATAVFANDATNLKQKFAVTKERGIHPLDTENLAPFIMEMINDEYYNSLSYLSGRYSEIAVAKAKSLIEEYKEKFTQVKSGLIFGTVAVRCKHYGFVTTGRGKKELDYITHVAQVDHENKQVQTLEGKATLNAPLLAKLFENPAVDHIVHYHEQVENLPTYKYAPPGTVRDTMRPNHTSFNIAEHGCMLLFDVDGNQI